MPLLRCIPSLSVSPLTSEASILPISALVWCKCSPTQHCSTPVGEMEEQHNKNVAMPMHCTVGDEGVIVDLSSISIFSAFSRPATAHMLHISDLDCWLNSTPFDVRTISVACKLKELQIFF